MGTIIQLPPLKGNGAREAMQRYFNEDTWPRYVDAAGFNGPELCAGDHLLAWLWDQGFRIVPHIAEPKDGSR